MSEFVVKIESLIEDLQFPVFTSEGDSGFDVYCTSDILILPGETVMIPLGFKMDIPVHDRVDEGYRWEAQARPRSGCSFKSKLRISNSPGTIDNYYRDEVKILADNIFRSPLETSLHSNTIHVQPITGHSVVTLDGKVVDLKEESVSLGEKKYQNHPIGTLLIKKGERFAQLVVAEIRRPIFVLGEVSREVARNSGFGESGLV